MVSMVTKLQGTLWVRQSAQPLPEL